MMETVAVGIADDMGNDDHDDEMLRFADFTSQLNGRSPTAGDLVRNPQTIRLIDGHARRLGIGQ